MNDHLNKRREERMAREEARIQKLRELNLKKYPKSESQANIANNQPSHSRNIASNQPLHSRNIASNQPSHSTLVKPTSNTQKNVAPTKNVFLVTVNVKNNFHVSGTSKRPLTAPVPKKVDYSNVKPKVVTNVVNVPSKMRLHNCARPAQSKEAIPVASSSNLVKKTVVKPIAENCDAEIKEKPSTSTSNVTSEFDKTLIADTATTENTNTKEPLIENKVLTEINKKEIIKPKIVTKNDPKSRKSLAAPTNRFGFDKVKFNTTGKSTLPQVPENTKSESVFERLYKPKFIAKKPANEVEKLQTDPDYLKKIVKNAGLILNKRHTVFDKSTSDKNVPPRRSISAVHFKRMSKNEVSNCIHKWASIGDHLNKGDLELNEDEGIKEDKVVSAIKSERKKVQFMTPIPSNFNTPRPDELQARLKSWLQKRGKSLESYQHLHCFGINHLKPELGTPTHIQFDDSVQKINKANDFDEENKENIALDSDSDDESFADTMNEPSEVINTGDKIDTDNWRNASIGSESEGFNDSKNYNDISITPSSTLTNVDDLLVGVLNDLTALLREGFDWQQAARWLRSIRSRFPFAPKTAAYWECRAALEDSRGDLPASLQCWEQAIAKGTEHSVVDSNLDQLLEKFMQLKISPQSGAPRQPDPKLVDVKNVFKSTIIRFAVQQAKLRRQSEQPSYTVTPVRRSARLSHCPPRTPLQLYDSVRQAASNAPQHVFKPNDNFVHTP